MTTRLSLASLGFACWLTASSFAADDKVEVLARGPVHEGYAEPSEREPVPSPVIPNEPPKAIEELPPDQKPEGDNIQWIPGYFAWDEDRKDFLWVSGFWRNAPPGRSWVPGSWRKATDGWQWSGGFWAGAKDDQAEVEYLPKPPAPLDNQGATTPAPSENHVYVPGSWVYRDRYVWRPGFWSEHRPNWVWTSAHYRWTPAGYVFIDGYWDYPLADRGMLFAPAYIPPTVYLAPSYVYTPTIVVREQCLYGAFFARRGFGSYYFGDYFAPSYASLGFVSWGGHVSASVTIGGYYDPLFSYYRCGFRSDPYWSVGIGNLYVGRYRGDYMRPPTTFVQQNTVINNITNNTTINNTTINNKTVNKTNLNNVTMLTSLNEAGRDGRRNLQTVSRADRQSELEAARKVRAVGERRANTEAELVARPGNGNGAKLNSPRSAKLDVVSRPTSPKTGLNPKTSDPRTSDPKTAGLTSPNRGAVSPPSPKATALGKVEPKASGTPTTPKGEATQGAGIARPPVTPKTQGTLAGPTKTPSTPATPKAGIDSPAPRTPTNPAPMTKTPASPPKSVAPSPGANIRPPANPMAPPKSVAPTTPSVRPSVSPAAPPRSVAPTAPSAKPSVSPPKSVSPPAKAATPAPRVAPKATPKTAAPLPQPNVARAVAPSVPRVAPAASQRYDPASATQPPVVNRPSPSVNRAPVVNRPAPSVNRAPVMNRPAPAVTRPAPSVNRAPVSRPAPAVNRAPVSRPAPAVSRPSPSVNRAPVNRAPVVNRAAPSVSRPAAPAASVRKPAVAPAKPAKTRKS